MVDREVPCLFERPEWSTQHTPLRGVQAESRPGDTAAWAHAGYGFAQIVLGDRPGRPIRTYARARHLAAEMSERARELYRSVEAVAKSGADGAIVQGILDRGAEQIAELDQELRWFEDAQAGLLRECRLEELGERLVASRIEARISQRELARRLGVSDAQVSRDERMNYAGVTLKRALRVLDALNVDVTLRFESSTSPRP